MTSKTVHPHPDQSNRTRADGCAGVSSDHGRSADAPATNNAGNAAARLAATPCVIYAAKSSEDKRGSIPTQLADCRAAANADGGIVAGEFTDEDESGWSANRGDGLLQARARAVELAEEHGAAHLWVQHTDRLARGDGLKADHLVEIFIEMRRANVRLRSVQDDYNLVSVSAAANAGDRNSGDSDRKSQAVRDGLRRTAERGDGEWICRGIKLDGYAVQRDFDERGRVTREVIKDPDRKHIYELMFEMALAGHSLQAIQLEFSSRGFTTAPVRKDHKPRPFDVNRLSQALDNPAYAGLVVHKGEILPNPGKWPPYVSVEDFYRLREQRRERSHATRRKVGRPVEGFLLAELARCECGSSAHAQTGRVRRADSSRPRTYVCRAHREHHRDSREHCPATPYDAITVDRAVIAGIEDLITDADAVREQLFAGRAAEQERLAKIAEQAHEDAAAAVRAADRAEERYAGALAAEDDSACEVLLGAAKRKREEAKRARTRREAALDALSAAADESEGDQAAAVMERIWEALSGRVHEAQGDIKKLNAALREWFDRFELHHHDDGSIGIVPFLSGTAVARVMREPALWPRYGAEAWIGSYHAIVPRRKGEMPAEMLARTQQRLSSAEAQGVEPVIDVANPPELTSTQNPQSPRWLRISERLALPAFTTPKSDIGPAAVGVQR